MDFVFIQVARPFYRTVFIYFCSPEAFLNSLLLLLLLLYGCAAPPKVVTLSDLAINPDAYRNTAVQFTGIVKENRYFEDRLGAWQLLVTDGKEELYCFKNGSNLSLLRRGVSLAEEAKGEEGAVTVTGKLVQPPFTSLVPHIEIGKLGYKDKSVSVEMADYPYDYYYYGYRHYHGIGRGGFYRPRFRRGC